MYTRKQKDVDVIDTVVVPFALYCTSAVFRNYCILERGTPRYVTRFNGWWSLFMRSGQ